MNITPIDYTNEIASPLVIQQLSPIAQQSSSFFIGRVPLPPGINASYKKVHIKTKSGKEYDRLAATPELAQFKESAGWELKLSRVDWALVGAIRASRHHVPLAMRLRFFYPTMWKQDIDGGEKAVMDAVFLHLELNDTLVVDKHTTKDVDKHDPHVEIELRCILSK